MKYLFPTILTIILLSCNSSDPNEYFHISKENLKDKIKGAWAAQTIGVTFGG